MSHVYHVGRGAALVVRWHRVHSLGDTSSAGRTGAARTAGSRLQQRRRYCLGATRRIHPPARAAAARGATTAAPAEYAGGGAACTRPAVAAAAAAAAPAAAADIRPIGRLGIGLWIRQRELIRFQHCRLPVTHAYDAANDALATDALLR